MNARLHVKGLAVGLTMLVGLFMVGQAGADDHCFGYGMPYSIYTLDSVPFYAMHPPVYYSYPVARPYGYSPFAYPAGTMTPDAPPAMPQTIWNPHVPRKQKASETSDRVTTVPRVILNPFSSGSKSEQIAGR